MDEGAARLPEAPLDWREGRDALLTGGPPQCPVRQPALPHLPEYVLNVVAAGKLPQHSSERATERVAVLMTPTEKAVYTDRAHSLGLSLGHFFREEGAAYVHRNAEAETRSLGEAEALDAALAEVKAVLAAQP